MQRVILRTRSFYEARLLATVEAMGIVGKDSVVCDVGANIGNHTIYFGTVMGAAKVLAFEPQAHCHETLCANIALNGLEDRVDEAVDSNDLARLDLIKIDVEGMQMAVLAGATGILEQRRPALWIELLARAGMADQATTFLAKFGYKPSPIGLNDVIFRV